jgi:hypothetical protein
MTEILSSNPMGTVLLKFAKPAHLAPSIDVLDLGSLATNVSEILRGIR